MVGLLCSSGLVAIVGGEVTDTVTAAQTVRGVVVQAFDAAQLVSASPLGAVFVLLGWALASLAKSRA